MPDRQRVVSVIVVLVLPGAFVGLVLYIDTFFS